MRKIFILLFSLLFSIVGADLNAQDQLTKSLLAAKSENVKKEREKRNIVKMKDNEIKELEEGRIGNDTYTDAEIDARIKVLETERDRAQAQAQVYKNKAEAAAIEIKRIQTENKNTILGYERRLQELNKDNKSLNLRIETMEKNHKKFTEELLEVIRTQKISLEQKSDSITDLLREKAESDWQEAIGNARNLAFHAIEVTRDKDFIRFETDLNCDWKEVVLEENGPTQILVIQIGEEIKVMREGEKVGTISINTGFDLDNSTNISTVISPEDRETSHDFKMEIDKVDFKDRRKNRGKLSYRFKVDIYLAPIRIIDGERVIGDKIVSFFDGEIEKKSNSKEAAIIDKAGY